MQLIISLELKLEFYYATISCIHISNTILILIQIHERTPNIAHMAFNAFSMKFQTQQMSARWVEQLKYAGALMGGAARSSASVTLNEGDTWLVRRS